MTIQAKHHKDGRITITVTLEGISKTMSLGEWSKLIANPEVVEAS